MTLRASHSTLPTSIALVALFAVVGGHVGGAAADGREARGGRLAADDVRRLALPALETTFAPCTITEVHVQSALRLPRGTLTVTAEGVVPRRSGRVPARVSFAVGDEITRINTSVTVDCPKPLVNPGDRVSIVAYAGAVRATAPGEATQTGRIGDMVRVRNLINGSSVMGRVAADGTVQVEIR